MRQPGASDTSQPTSATDRPAARHTGGQNRAVAPRLDANEYVLIVDDDDAVRHLLGSQLDYLGYPCRSARTGEQAIVTLTGHGQAVLVLSDVQMPGLTGVELLEKLKQLDSSLQVVMISGHQDMETVRGCLRQGAYDYLIKPYELHELANTVQRAIERSRLLRQNEEYRRNLERMVLERTKELRQTRDIAILTLAKLAESRDYETGNHLDRMAAYSRRLAEELRRSSYARTVNEAFIEHLYKSSPLHDIGKVGIDDAILRKPGPLTEVEWAVMQTHTTIGGDTLRSVIERYEGHSFLVMGMEIAYSHHERWDGSGYPSGLAGDAIPLAARVVAVADAYDAITSERPYHSALDHREAVRRIRMDRDAHFDPVLVEAFERCHEEFAAIGRQLHADAASQPSD